MGEVLTFFGGFKVEDEAEYHGNMQVDVLARTIWGEAQFEDREVMRAIANTILNRVAVAKAQGTYWWGNDVISVCQKPYQFACWNRSSPKYKEMLAVGRESGSMPFTRALSIARNALNGGMEDQTKGATHYYVTGGFTPPYAGDARNKVQIGRFTFCRIYN